MLDPNLAGLLSAVAAGDLDAVLVLGDLLEEQGDERAPVVRRLYARLYDDWLYAPFAFGHHRLVPRTILPLFPEYDGEVP